MKTAYDFQARMAAGKAQADRQRYNDKDGGGSSVQVFATTAAMLHRVGRVECDNFDRWLVEVQHRVTEIIEQSRFDIYADRDGWADLTISSIPF